MKHALLAFCALVVLCAVPSRARAAGECGTSETTPMWVDFGDGSVPFWQTFAVPGNVVAASNLIYPPKIRERGATTAYFDLYLNKRVGTPTNPAKPDVIVEKANRLFDIAVASSACATPIIALNELFGASLPSPWSATNAQYRANVLAFMRALAARGAHPYLLVSSRPYTGGEAGDWWRSAAQVADLVPEVYFGAPSLFKQGAVRAGLRMRTAFRRALTSLTELGIPASKLGLVLGFQSGSRIGGREGLQPAPSWFEVVKWQVLAARKVGIELGLGTIWSWGWATWGTTTPDLDKAAAACVYLWTRDPKLCDGPAAAGPGFDASLDVGGIALPTGYRLLLGTQGVSAAAVTALTKVTGDADVAYSALFARTAELGRASVRADEVAQAERAVIVDRFHGNAAAYRSALARAGATVAIGRDVIGDQLRRKKIALKLSVAAPAEPEIAEFYEAYPGLLARRVRAVPGPWWLGGRRDGLALSGLAPATLFRAPAGPLTLQGYDGTYRLRLTGDARPLGVVSLTEARGAIRVALLHFAREAAYVAWSAKRQASALKQAVSDKDDFPAVASVDLTAYLPFLALGG